MRLETILSAQAVRHPDKIALVCGDERITYRDLDRRIRSVASGLRTQGIGPGDRVVVFLSNGVEIVELFYAAFSVGAIVIPVTIAADAPRAAAYLFRQPAPCDCVRREWRVYLRSAAVKS